MGWIKAKNHLTLLMDCLSRVFSADISLDYTFKYGKLQIEGKVFCSKYA
jgi:hypothetical protein